MAHLRAALKHFCDGHQLDWNLYSLERLCVSQRQREGGVRTKLCVPHRFTIASKSGFTAL
jgi:hypothetical protein